MFDDPSLVAAYRSETEQLHADRLPLAVALYLALIGLSGVVEHFLCDGDLLLFLPFYGLEAAAFAPILLARRALLRRGWLQRVSVATWCVSAWLLDAYGVAAGRPAELIALAAICLMSGTSLLLPWGVRGQAAIVTSALAAFALALGLQPPTAVPAAYLFFATAAAAAIAVFGAHHLDLHRLALFCEATQREEEAAISQSLVAIAKEINAALDATDVLDRIAGVTRSALHASWSVIMLRDPARDCLVFVGGAGEMPQEVASLRGVEFGAGAFPLVDRILRQREVALTDVAADPMTAGLMRRWQTHSVLGAALLRREEVVGVLLAATQGRMGRFSERGHELFHGIAQHVAIALSNVRMVADLRRANELKSEFLSTMSHELRTPLNVIIGYSDLLRDEAFGPLARDQQDVLDRLDINAHTLLELINSTLEVNRLEAGRSGLHLREVELRQLLTELQLESEQLPRQHGVTLRWEVPRTGETVRTDPVKLKIVVRNLVANALKFTKRGSVAVHVGFDSRARMLDLAVRDTGTGIDAEHLPKIFDMFHQGPGAAHRGGVGLGLYIVKHFVELLGGRVTAASRIGEGSLFNVSVPVGVAAQPLSVAAQPASLEEHRRRRSA